MIEFDAETTDLTARNAAAPVDPSEAPSTPTVTGDGPFKSNTFPTPRAAGRDGVFEDEQDNRKSHVLFLDSNDVDGSGRLFGTDGHFTETSHPGRAAPVTLGKEISPVMTSSPQTIQRPLPVDSMSTSTPALPIDGLPTRSSESPNDELITTPRNEDTEALPVSAQMPHEMEKVNGEKHPLHPLALEDGTPRTSMTSNRSEMIPEGKGSKRMFKMSKMFSESSRDESGEGADDRRGRCAERSLGHSRGFGRVRPI